MDKDGIIHSDKLPLETNVHDGELGTVVPPESMQFPRKDSQDSGKEINALLSLSWVIYAVLISFEKISVF